MGFDAFAERTGVIKRRGTPCHTCSLPKDLLAELEELRRRKPPIPFGAIEKYLESEYKLRMSESTLAAHWRRCVK